MSRRVIPQELTAAVVADPGNDLPRLVAADAYDDIGQGNRAEFIRLQCRIERQNPCAADDMAKARVLFGQIWECFACLRFEYSHPSYTPTMVHDLEQPEVRAYVRRGFVDSIELPSEFLFGGPCVRCNGSGVVRQMTCLICKGRKRLKSRVDRLFRTNPIRSVNLTNRFPYPGTLFSTRGTFAWYGELGAYPRSSPERSLMGRGDGAELAVLPGGVFERLRRPVYIEKATVWSENVVWYSSEQEADDALSEAVVAYGRNSVGWKGVT